MSKRFSYPGIPNVTRNATAIISITVIVKSDLLRKDCPEMSRSLTTKTESIPK